MYGPQGGSSEQTFGPTRVQKYILQSCGPFFGGGIDGFCEYSWDAMPKNNAVAAYFRCRARASPKPLNIQVLN